MTVAAFIFGLALGFIGYAWISAPERYRRARALRNAQRLAVKYRRLYRESVARESLHLMGPLAMWGPLDEGTPIADALSFELWDAQMEGEQ